MAYTISKTNGGTLIVLNDGLVDNAVTSLTLIGKNVSNFGDAQNENFVKLLENFCHVTEPRSALQGQIWFNSSAGAFRPAVWDSVRWRPLAVSLYGVAPTDANINAGGSAYAACRPGDFWFDSVNKQLHVVTSGTTTATETVLIGPEKVLGFAETKLSSVKMFDTLAGPHATIHMTLNGEVIGIISGDTFTPSLTSAVPGFTKINRGITFKNYSSSTRYTTATTDVQLYGLHEQLDTSVLRRNVTEQIQSDWYFENGKRIYLGSSGESSITWNTVSSFLSLSSNGTIRLQTSGNNLVFDGTSIFGTASVDLGTQSNKIRNVISENILTTVSTSTTANIGSLNAINASISLLNATNISVVNTVTAQTVSASSVIGDSITTPLVNSTLISASTVTATTVSASIVSASNVVSTVNQATTVSAITVTANTYNGLNFYGGNFYGNELYENGSRVVTSATISNFDFNAKRLEGSGATGFVTASQGITGNTIAQRTVTGGLTATSIEVATIRAIGGLPTSSGSISGNWLLTDGSKLEATYADLAEYYIADAPYEPGTVLEFGGEFEVTVAQDGTRRVAGVVSTNPAYTMNSKLKGENVVAIALTGRVPVKVRGKIQKGDMMVASGSGYARPDHNPILGSVIGKALEDFEGAEGVIEVVVGRL